jgi:Tfp pilus assembly protein PilF
MPLDDSDPAHIPAAANSRAWACAVVVLLAASVWGVYGRSIHAPFIFDDYNSVLANASITRLWPPFGDSSARGPWNPPPQFCTAGRPLVNFTLAVNYYFGQLDPTGYHVFDIIIHVLSGALIFGIVRRTLDLPFFGGRFEGAAVGLALAVAVVWALHPLQTEAVIYVTQRTELLVCFCYLATLYSSLRYWQAVAPFARAAWLFVAVFACAAGMASKEIMVSAPVIVLLYERTFFAGSFPTALRRSWPLYCGLALTWLLLVALNVVGPRSHSTGFGSGVPAYVWWFTEAKVLWVYLRLAVWPWPLVIHYEYPYLDSIAAAWPWLLPTFALVALTTFLFWRRTAAGFALVFLFAILSPTLLVPVVTEVAAERRMYLPLAALVTLAVTFGYLLAQRVMQSSAGEANANLRARGPLAVVLTVCGGVALISAICGARRAEVYNQPLALWEDAIRHQPNSSSSRINLGMALAEAGRPQEAIPQFEAALRLKPGAADAANDLGMALISAGRAADAVVPLERSLALEPDFAEAHNNLAIALATTGDESGAVDHLRRAIALRPDYVEARMNLGLSLARKHQAAAAVEQLEEALRLRPTLLSAYQPLASAYFELNQPPQAIQTARRAIEQARQQGDKQMAEQITAWLQAHSTSTPQP